MLGIPLAFLFGYAIARYFGDAIREIIKSVHAEVGKAIEEWF